MNRLTKKLAVMLGAGALSVACASPTSAAMLTLDLTDGGAAGEAFETGNSFAFGTITIAATALADDVNPADGDNVNGGSIVNDAAGLGINANGFGPNDPTEIEYHSGFSTRGADEALVLTISDPNGLILTLNSVTFVGLTSDETAIVALGGNSTTVSGVALETFNWTVADGDQLTLSVDGSDLTAGSGFADGYALSSVEFAIVPEPASLALLVAGGVLMSGRRRLA